MASNTILKDVTQRISTKSILFICILLSVSLIALELQSQVSASEVYPAKGTWKGTVSGTGTILMKYPINLTGTMEGSFDGDTTHGKWTGIYIASYKISQVSTGTITEQEVGEIKGNYTSSIDSSGMIAGEAMLKLTGPLTGELRMKLKGSESASGDLKGTYSGDLTRNTFSYGGTPVAAEFSANVAGEFEGTEARSTPTESPIPAPTATTPTPTSTTVTPSKTLSPTQESPQYVQYGIVAVVATAIVAGGYLLIARRARHK